MYLREIISNWYLKLQKNRISKYKRRLIVDLKISCVKNRIIKIDKLRNLINNSVIRNWNLIDWFNLKENRRK